MTFRSRLLLSVGATLSAGLAPLAADAAYVNFESQHVHPLALTPDGTKLLAVNTPDNRLAVFAVNGAEPVLLFEVPVGIEPVSVAAQSNTRAWVVNHVSDSVSLVDLVTGNVVETLAVGDEPTDVVFASGKAFVCVSQEDAVKIFNPAQPWQPPVVVPIFGSDPQALCRSIDGQKVYVGIFESGNRTTLANIQDVVNHGGLPAPNPPGRPNTGLILRFVAGHWVDELNRNYDATHPYTLPDHDVAVLTAGTANPVPQYIDGLGTLIYNLGVHPVTGKLWVTNTEAQNHIRFEPNLRGKFVRTRVTIVDPLVPASANPVDLNPHIDYGTTPGPPTEIDRSLSQPGGIVFRATGGVAYLTALGSATVAVLDDAGNVTSRIAVGQGPSGLALDEARHRLYVSNRFTQTLSVVDTDSRTVVGTLSLGYDPSPPSIRDGRKFLYDARLSSGHGDVACASCHAGGGNMDAVAWDLGDPNGSFAPPPPGQIDPFLSGFHPMKGPMTTQSLRGLSGTGVLHWRGDRADFQAFNGAFVSLMGRDSELSTADMQAFTDFVMTLRYPGNPNQNLDRTFPNPASGPSAERGRQAFSTMQLDGVFTCAVCHALPTGTNGFLINGPLLQTTQDIKIPHLRNLYEKTGFAATPGEKKRGYGFTHDGAIPTLMDFLRLPLFSFGSNEALRQDVEAFLMAFDTGTAPAVGQQKTVTAINGSTPSTIAWIDLMIAQVQAANVDLIVKGRLNSEPRGWVYAGGGTFRSDRTAEPPIAKDMLRALARAGSELTYTAVPPGTGIRAGIDRDEDGFLDRTELDRGSDPADPASTPMPVAIGPVGGDTGGGARLLASFPNPAPAGATMLAFEIGARQPVRLRIYDSAGRLVTTLLDGEAGPGTVRRAWNGIDAHGRRVAAGKYYSRLEAGGRTQSRPLLLLH